MLYDYPESASLTLTLNLYNSCSCQFYLVLNKAKNVRVFTCQVRPGSLFHEDDDAKLFASWVSLDILHLALDVDVVVYMYGKATCLCPGS